MKTGKSLYVFVIVLLIASAGKAYTEITIIAIGDSGVYGQTQWGDQPGHKNTIFGGWVTRLQNRLDDEFPEAYRVINRGIDGDTAQGVFNRLERDVFSRNPEMLIISIGANDASNFSGVNPPARTADAYRGIMEKIILKIKEELPSTDTILCGIVLFNSKYTKIYFPNLSHASFEQEEYDAKILSYNEVIKELASLHRLFYFDILAFWPQDVDARWDLMSDGLHANDAGYDLITEHLYEFIFGYVAVKPLHKMAITWGEIKNI